MKYFNILKTPFDHALLPLTLKQANITTEKSFKKLSNRFKASDMTFCLPKFESNWSIHWSKMSVLKTAI